MAVSIPGAACCGIRHWTDIEHAEAQFAASGFRCDKQLMICSVCGAEQGFDLSSACLDDTEDDSVEYAEPQSAFEILRSFDAEGLASFLLSTRRV